MGVPQVRCAEGCGKEAKHTLHDIPMCESYFIDALEHSAHITTHSFLSPKNLEVVHVLTRRNPWTEEHRLAHSKKMQDYWAEWREKRKTGQVAGYKILPEAQK